MATFSSADCTAVPAKAIHAGVNVRVATYTLNETASGSTNINMIALPPGARVVNVIMGIGNNAVGIVAAPGDVRVQDSQGNVYISSASANKTVHLFNPSAYDGFAKRVTSSCNMQIVINAVATGTASSNWRLMVEYIKEEDGD